MNTTSNKKKKNLFLSGVLVLTAANLLVKAIGATLKIPLHNLLGDEGMCYYNCAYDIYVWLYMVSTAGLPVTISILISGSRAKGNFKEAKKIFRITLAMFIIIGLAGMGIMLGGARQFASAYKQDNAVFCIMTMAPTLFLICVSSCIRGYFQGYQNMFPTAISEIIEAVGKLAMGMLLASYAIQRGYPLHTVAAYAILGVTIGVAGGMLYLIVAKFLFRESIYNEEYMRPDSDEMQCRSTKTLLKVLIVTAVPITISASIMSFTNMLDSMIISRRLQSIGYSATVAASMLGNFKTLVVTLFNLPPALIYPIASSIVPLMSATISSGNHEKAKDIMNSSMRISALLSIPCALGLSVLSEPILKLLFDSASAEIAAPLLSIQALSVFFVGMLSITNAILQSHGYERKPIISMVAGSAVKIISSYILIGIPKINIMGAPIGTFLCYLTIVAFNFYFMAKYVKIIPDVKRVFIRPLVASVICAAVSIGSYRVFAIMAIPEKISVISAIILAMAVYLVTVFLIRAITEEDVILLPKGKKLCSILKKLHLIRQ